MDNNQITFLWAMVLLLMPVCLVIFFRYQLKIKSFQDRIDHSERIAAQNDFIALKYRVMALEKIITDKGYQLDEEIGKLKSIK